VHDGLGNSAGFRPGYCFADEATEDDLAHHACVERARLRRDAWRIPPARGQVAPSRDSRALDPEAAPDQACST
jgi:hypothetical protein